MAYSFELSFQGICAFVPDQPFFRRDPVTKEWSAGSVMEVVVLVPDLRIPAVAGFDRKLFRSPHFPMISFDLEDLDDKRSTRKIDLVAREYNSKEESGLCMLRQEVIQIEIPGVQAKPTFEDTIGTKRVPQDTKEERSLWWLPRLSEIAPKFASARASHHPDSFQQSLFPSELIAAVTLRSGHLHCQDFNRDRAGKIVPWRFGSPKSTGKGLWNKAIGNRFCVGFWDLDEGTQPVTLRLEQRSTSLVTTELVFRPSTGNTRVRVELSNLEPEEMFADNGLLPIPSPDPDFEEFYRKITSKAGGTVIPNLGPGFMSFGEVRKPCASTTLDGFS